MYKNLPLNCGIYTKDRARLWNTVEHVEKSKNAQLAREVEIALPRELTRAQHIALAKAYAQTFANEGMVADMAIHDKGDGNPHAHILLTMRPFREDGTWGEKSRKDYVRDASGEKIRLKSGEYKSRKVDLVDWNTEEKLVAWRKNYEKIVNFHLEKAGLSVRICVDSYEKQGIEKIPTKHLGHYAHQLEQQGIPSVRGDRNREVSAENRQREAIDREVSQLHTARNLEAARLEQALSREVASQGVPPQKVVSEEAMLQKFDEWRRQAQEALQQSAPAETTRSEALQKEAEVREKERREAEKADREKREAQWKQQRKFIPPSPLQQPPQLEPRPKIEPSPYEKPEMQPTQMDWQKLVEEAKKRRPDWVKLAEQQPGHIDWQKLASEQQRVDWQQRAEQLKWQRPDWEKLASESRGSLGTLEEFHQELERRIAEEEKHRQEQGQNRENEVDREKDG